MTRLMSFALLLTLVAVFQLPLQEVRCADFKFTTFYDPYMIVKSFGDTSIFHPSSYYRQLDSLGLRFCHSIADAASTNNPYNIKIIGQDSINIPRPSQPGASIEFSYALSGAHNVYAKTTIDRVDSSGYDWNYGVGRFDPPNPPEDRVGWLCDVNEHVSGAALTLTGPKIASHYPKAPDVNPCFGLPVPLRTYVRLKVLSSGQPTDTICKVNTGYFDHFLNNWNTRSEYYTVADAPIIDQWYVLNKLSYQPKFNDWRSMTVSVVWWDKVSALFEEISIRSTLGNELHNSTQFSLDTAFSSFYGRINSANHDKFYPRDEPGAVHMWSYALFDQAGRRNGAHHKSTTSMNYYYQMFDYEVSPDEYQPNYYVITATTDSATTSSTNSVQNAYQSLINWIEPRAEEALNVLHKPWLMYTQVGALYAYNSNSCSSTPVWRTPRPAEMKVLTALPLCYGASGLGWFVYPTLYNPCVCPIPQTQDTSSVLIAELLDKAALASSPPVDTSVANGNVLFRGLVDWSPTTNRYERNAQWYVVRDIMQLTDSLWTTLGTLTWQAATDWKGIASVSPILDSIYTVGEHYDSAYVHLGRFLSPTDEEYYLVVNQRSWPEDSQTVRIKALDRPGVVIFHDVYENQSYFAYDSSGTVTFETRFAAGQAKLFKVTHVQNFKGTWTGTWPRYSTIKVVGDVTVPSGQTLTIQTPVSVKANTDSLSGGWSVIKSEIIVNGTLVLDGSASNRITIQPDQTADSSWYGIRVGVNGSLDADNVVIKRAYTGLSLQYANASIVNSRIENCFMHGIYAEGCTFTMEHDTLLSTNTNISEDSVIYGMNWGVKVTGDDQDVGPTISNCYFSNMKRPIDIFWSYGKLRNCLITRSGLYQSLGKGTPAINLGRYANVDSIYNCEIRNYKYGVKAAGSRMEALIQSSEIGSDLYRDVQHPYMYIGVNADSGNLANCKIRSTCFRGIEQHHIFRRWTLVDAGTSGDYGHNNFFVDTVKVHPSCQGDTCAYYLYPYVAIYNVSGASVGARGNYFDPMYYWIDNSLADNISGPVDTLNAYQIPDAFCEETPPPDMKAAITTPVSTRPREFSLNQNYPNPFNPETGFSFYLPSSSRVRVDIFNVLGQKIVTLLDGTLSAGEHTVHWNSKDERGVSVASGLYLYRVTAGEQSLTKKMLLMK